MVIRKCFKSSLLLDVSGHFTLCLLNLLRTRRDSRYRSYRAKHARFVHYCDICTIPYKLLCPSFQRFLVQFILIFLT